MKRRRPPEPPREEQMDIFAPPPPERVRGGVEGTRAALTALEKYRAEMVAKLRQAALDHWNRTRRPVSVNDIRYVLAEEHYDGDPRILGATFKIKTWKRVADGHTDAPLTNFSQGHYIGCWVPREESE